MNERVGPQAPWPQLYRSASGDVIAVSGFGRPFGLARGGEGQIYVADMDLHAICQIDLELGEARWLGDRSGWSAPALIQPGTVQPAAPRRPGCFNGPHSVAAGENGTLYIVTYYNPGLHIVSTEGAISTCDVGLGLVGPATGQFDRDGRLLVAEYKLNAIFAVTSEGRFVAALGGGSTGFVDQRNFDAGHGTSEFDRPHMCRAHSDGTLLVVDTWNHRLQRFTSQGHFLGVLDGTAPGWHSGSVKIEPSDRPGAFRAPVAVSIADDGRFVVTDWGNNRLQWFDREGQLLKIEEPGLGHPYDAQIFGHRLAIADSHHGRILLQPI